MTGVVASKSVTEASKGTLRPIGNRPQSGWAVRPLKWHASWVQNVVRQFGLYLSWAQEICVALTLVREDRVGLTSGEPVVPPGARPGIRVRIG